MIDWQRLSPGIPSWRIEMQRRLLSVGTCTLLISSFATCALVGWDTAALAKPAAGGKSAQPAVLKNDIRLTPERIRWGLSLQQVAKIYDDAFDVQYAPVYKRTDPGVEMQAIDAEVADKKELIRRMRVDFGVTPTGVDQGPLRGEYSYNNGESMTHTQLPGGTQRYFFFFNDKLWKVYDEYKLGSKLGTSWSAAISALTELFGGPPKIVEADPQHGKRDEAIWNTQSMQIRAVNREDQKIVAVAFADRSIQDDIATHRPNRLGSPDAMDSQVRDATTHEPAAAPKPGAGKSKKK